MFGTEHARNHPALTDTETGLANGLHFDLVYNYLFLAGNRGLPFTVMLVSAGSSEVEPDGAPSSGGDPPDLDENGSSAVRELGQAIERTTRTSDLVSHVGSGRYVVLLLGTNVQGARIAADRIEAAVRRESTGPLSFGMAAYHDGYNEAQDLLQAADRALLAAEAAGGGVEFA